MKYFIGADIEAPHLCYYAQIDDDPYFSGRWSWADKDGLPEQGINVLYFNTREEAQEVVDDMKKSGAGIPMHADTIQVVELDV